LWDLITDWGRWDRFYPQDPGFQVTSHVVEGENRKLGCVRYGQLAVDKFSYERLIAIDNDKHYLSYNMEENNLCDGLRNYVAKVQVCTVINSSGKTYSINPTPRLALNLESEATPMEFLG